MPEEDDSIGSLKDRIGNLLVDSLGGIPAIGPVRLLGRIDSPVLRGLVLGLTYNVIFVAAPWHLFHTPTLKWLSIWGGCYFIYAAVAAETASSSISTIINSGILPYISVADASAIMDELRISFSQKRIRILSTSVAALATVLSVIALYHEIPSIQLLETACWASGFFILYLTATRAVDVARFYGVFAAHLGGDADPIIAVSPAQSLRVRETALVGRIALSFWALIAFAILTLLPLSWLLIGNEGSNLFVDLLVPIASFFSLGVGTIVFLRSERNLKDFVKQRLDRTLDSLEKEINGLFARRTELADADWKRLEELRAVHKDLQSNGYYQSFGAKGLSFALPFVTPLTAALSHLSLVSSWLHQHIHMPR